MKTIIKRPSELFSVEPNAENDLYEIKFTRRNERKQNKDQVYQSENSNLCLKRFQILATVVSVLRRILLLAADHLVNFWWNQYYSACFLFCITDLL